MVLEGDGNGRGSFFDESGEAFRELRARLDEGLSPAVRAAVGNRIGAAVAEACEIPLTTILAEAWKKYRPLREYCDPGRHPPGETATVELATHTVNSVQHPSVEFLVGEKSIFTLKLDANVTIKLETAVLTIENAMFKELATGSSQVTGSLSYKGALLAERKVGEYKSPGRRSFGEGVPICPDIPREHVVQNHQDGPK
jgi:hypothetical protein